MVYATQIKYAHFYGLQLRLRAFVRHIDEFGGGGNDDLCILAEGFLQGPELSEKLCVSNEVRARGLVDKPGRPGLALRRQDLGLLDPSVCVGIPS